MGDVYGSLIAHVNIALVLLERAATGDKEEAERLLNVALRSADTMRFREVEQIRRTLFENGMTVK